MAGELTQGVYRRFYGFVALRKPHLQCGTICALDSVLSVYVSTEIPLCTKC